MGVLLALAARLRLSRFIVQALGVDKSEYARKRDMQIWLWGSGIGVGVVVVTFIFVLVAGLR